MPAALRREILERYCLAHRSRAETHIAEAVDRGGRVIHIASHSFTPVLDGQVRDAEIGLLYDPARPLELEFCRRWQASLKAHAPELKIRRNYPYAGKSDGFTAHLRPRFEGNVYLGIELEINQKHVAKGGWHWRDFKSRVVDSLLGSQT